MSTYVGILGDTHCNRGWVRSRLLDFADLGVTKILQLGDFGVWSDNAGLKFMFKTNRVLRENNQTLYVTLGNHENYNMVNKFVPLTEGENAGWLVDPDFPNILFAPRPHRWEWEGTSFLSVGGGNSIDRDYRKPNITWWEGEQITYKQVLDARAGGKADIMVAHDCPINVPLFGGHKAGVGGWLPTDIDYANQSRKQLQKIVNVAKPDLYLHGHYHFFAEHNTPMVDDNKTPYMLHSIGLDKDENLNNIGVLELPSKQFDIIDYKLNTIRHSR